MKILVINGSPKKEHSDVLHITNAFLEGMNEVEPQDTVILHSIDLNIRYCLGCFHCMRSGGECVQKDDMAGILEQILDSDLLIFSFPLYYYGMPASLKALLDRTLPLGSMAMKKEGDRYVHVVQKDVSKLRFMMICGCGFPNSARNFEPAVMAFTQTFPNNRTIITMPETPMFAAPDAAELTKPRLNLVWEAGAQYARNGEINPELLKTVCSPMMPEEQYAAIVNQRK